MNLQNKNSIIYLNIVLIAACNENSISYTQGHLQQRKDHELYTLECLGISVKLLLLQNILSPLYEHFESKGYNDPVSFFFFCMALGMEPRGTEPS